MAKDQYEQIDGRGHMQDRYGRQQFIAKPKHAAVLQTDVQRGMEWCDADGRKHMVLLDEAGDDIVTRLPGEFNVKTYGALGDASTDDTAAIQACLTAAGALGAHLQTTANVYFPPGDYKYSTVLSVPQGVNIRGAGRATRLAPQGCDGFTFPAATGIAPQAIENFWIESWSTSGDTTAFKVPGTTDSSDRRYGLRFRDIHLGFHNVGFDLRTAWDCTLERIQGYSVGYGVVVRGQCARVHVKDCVFIREGFTASELVVGEGTLGTYVTEDTYAVGGTLKPEDVQYDGNTFLGYAKGAYIKDVLWCIVDRNALDFSQSLGLQLAAGASGVTVSRNYIALDTALTDYSFGILAHGGGSKIAIEANYIWCGDETPPSNVFGMYLSTSMNGTVVRDNLVFNFDGATGADLLLESNKDCVVYGNSFRSAGQHSIRVVTATGDHDIGPNELVQPVSIAVQAVASAAALTLPAYAEAVSVTGTTNITSVTASRPGRRVTLIFAGILTFTDGSNLKLSANFVTSADDTITLVCDGTNWYEIGRSAN